MRTTNIPKETYASFLHKDIPLINGINVWRALTPFAMAVIKESKRPTETRKFLQYAYCDGEWVVICDGKVLLMVLNTMGLYPGYYDWDSKGLTKTKVIGPEGVEYKYPNYKAIIPNYNNMVNYRGYVFDSGCCFLRKVEEFRDGLFQWDVFKLNQYLANTYRTSTKADSLPAILNFKYLNSLINTGKWNITLSPGVAIEFAHEQIETVKIYMMPIKIKE